MENQNLKQEVEKVWSAFNGFKENAEQHMFPKIFLFDLKMQSAYKDLQKNFDEKHASLFIRYMKEIVFKKLGISY